MRQLDLKQIAAKVSVEHGIRVDPDDRILAVVTLNCLVPEQSANEIVEEVRSATREFEQAAESVQLRARALVAQRVRESVAVLRQEIAREIGNPSTQDERGSALPEKLPPRLPVILSPGRGGPTTVRPS
jgi:hypothetical protein